MDLGTAQPRETEESLQEQEEDPQEVARRNFYDPLGVHKVRYEGFGVPENLPSVGWGEVGQQ